MICLCLRSGFCLSTDLTLARICAYRLALETGEEEMRIFFEHLEHRIKPMQLGVTARLRISAFSTSAW